MSTKIDWSRELDAAVAKGPDQPVEHFVVAGRRALRRRRAVTGLAGLAATVALGGAVWAVAPDDGPARSDAPVATQAPSPEEPQRTVTESPSAQATALPPPRTQPTRRLAELPTAERGLVDFLGNPAALTTRGLVLAPDTTAVLQRVENPMGYTADQGVSLGIRATQAGVERYSLLTAEADGSSTSTSTVDASGDFAGWLDGAVRTQRTLDVANGVTPAEGTERLPDTWLQLGPDGQVAAGGPGVVLLSNRADVDLGTSFALGAERTGVARLSVDGVLEYVAYRVIDSRLEVIPGNGRFDTLQDFIAWARDQYASGEGLR